MLRSIVCSEVDQEVFWVVLILSFGQDMPRRMPLGALLHGLYLSVSQCDRVLAIVRPRRDASSCQALTHK